MTTTSKTGKSLRLWRGSVQLPDNDGTFSTKTLRASWNGYDKIDPSWSLTDVLNWVHTGRSPRGNHNANSNSNNNNNNNNNNVRVRRATRNEKRGLNSNNNSNSNNNNNRRSNSNSNNK